MNLQFKVSLEFTSRWFQIWVSISPSVCNQKKRWRGDHRVMEWVGLRETFIGQQIQLLQWAQTPHPCWLQLQLRQACTVPCAQIPWLGQSGACDTTSFGAEVPQNSPELPRCQRLWKRHSRWPQCSQWVSRMTWESPPPTSDLGLD